VPFENLSLLLAVFLSRSHKAAQECHFDYTIIIASRCLVNKKGGAGAKKHAERKNGRGRADQRVILSIIRALFGHFAPFPFQNTIKCNIMEVP
jgi:hypothetical protein